MCRACGFGDSVDEEEGMLVRTAIDGQMVVHRLSSGPHVLVRVLQREFGQQESALDNAKARRGRYAREARALRQPGDRLHVIYLVGGVLITSLAAARSQLEQSGHDDDRAETVLAVLRYSLAALPILLSVLMSLRKDLNLSVRATAYEYGAALIESATWRYSMRTGQYSNSALVATGTADVPTARAVHLATELQRICHAVNSAAGTPPSASGDEDETASVDETVSSDADKRLGLLPGEGPEILPHPENLHKREDGYVKTRLAPHLAVWQAKTRALQRDLVTLKGVTYVIGAVGSILALVGLDTWVAVTTALVTAIAARDAATPLEERLRRAHRAVERLTDAETTWQAVPQEKRRMQQELDRLVSAVESGILGALTRPVGWEGPAEILGSAATSATVPGTATAPRPIDMTANGMEVAKSIESWWV